ncbi:MAG: translation initiation factor [Myxococcota bacterium]
MAKRDKPPPSALTHNPFAALAPKEAPAAPKEPATPETKDGPVFAGKVVVRREKKGRGGKTVTRISGIAPDHRARFQKEMKKALGCGATLEGEDLVLLGSLVDRAADYLEGQGARRVVRAN